MTDHDAPGERRPEPAGSTRTSFPLTRNELLLILAFWTFLAVLIAANRLVDPRGGGLRTVSPSVPVALAFAEAYLWALFTPLIFWLASRYSVERGGRLSRGALFLIVGIVIAVFVDRSLDVIRTAVLPPPTQDRGPRFGPSPWSFRRLSMINDLVTYLGVLSAGLARDFSLRYRARREDAVRFQAQASRLEAQLAEARLDALRRQLDPHFLFNTLNAVSTLVERDPKGVRRMVSRLSQLLRHSIEGATEQEITLERELALLQQYVEIMQIRFQGKLDVQMRIAPGTREAMVPNMILQPLVENALKHGVSQTDDEGRLAIEAAIEGPDLVLRVTDNGPGLDELAEDAQSLGDRSRLGDVMRTGDARPAVDAVSGDARPKIVAETGDARRASENARTVAARRGGGDAADVMRPAPEVPADWRLATTTGD
ncbi:MAG TPA: histidine kinase, partial [Longimicrobiaceae bacterium]|nr:histidine kinase [Longimicrobiaceae bacterium]